MGRRGRGMGGGGRSGSFGGSRSGGFRPGVGGGRGRSGRGQSGGFSGRNVGGFGGTGYRRSGGLGSMLPWFLLGRMGGGRRYGGGRGGCGAGGCLLPIIVMAIFGFLFMGGQNNSTTQNSHVDVRESTIQREPISEGLVNETSYYTDQVNWIVNDNELIPGLQHFYEKTNVQPHVFMTDNIDGETNPDINDVQMYTEELYDELFDDEAHALLVFFENDAYSQQVSYHTAVGKEAEKVFDDEAQEILFDYLDYYYFSDLSEESYFSTAFKDTADRMMDTSSGLFSSSASDSGDGLFSSLNWGSIGLGVIGFLAVLGIITFIMQRRQKSEEADIIGKDDDNLSF